MKERSLKIIVALMTVSVIGIITIQFYWIIKSLTLEEEKFNKNVGIALAEVVKLIEKNETANILVREITTSNDNHVVFLNDKKGKVIRHEIHGSGNDKNILTETNDADHDVQIKVVTADDSLNRQIRVFSNIQIDGDTTIEETITWQSDVDSLIRRKTKIIESVFDELILSEKGNVIFERLNKERVDSLLSEKFNEFGITTSYDFGFSVDGKDSLILVEENIAPELLSTTHKAKLFPYDVFNKPNYLLVSFKNKTEFFLSSIWWVLIVSFLFTGLIIFLFYQTLKMLINQKKLTEMKNDLLNNITHEFKTPISTISLAADIIGASKNLEGSKYTEIIKTESKRLTNMVEEILSAAALENSTSELNKERTDIHNLIRDVVAKYQLPLKIKEGVIETKLGAKNSTLNIDKQQMFNTISNIIDNAIKYNSGNPEIDISTIDSNNALEIVFEDNGIGIETKNYDKIFETFYRVPTGNIHDVKGNGIGLSYVKKIVEAHGGKISIKSEINKGSKFIIHLPKY